jgi:acyloxyacyl hydrolase
MEIVGPPPQIISSSAHITFVMFARFPEPVPHMTTPVTLHKNVMNVLNKLNDVLPFGSHVILIGLVDGGFIYPTMANRIHPLGQLHSNIRYNDVYTWFNCMEMGPCSAWMNSNVTLRKVATQVGHMS